MEVSGEPLTDPGRGKLFSFMRLNFHRKCSRTVNGVLRTVFWISGQYSGQIGQYFIIIERYIHFIGEKVEIMMDN